MLSPDERPDLFLFFMTDARLDFNKIYDPEDGSEIITPSAQAVKGGVALKLLPDDDYKKVAPPGVSKKDVSYNQLDRQQVRALTKHSIYKAVKAGAGELVSAYLSNYDSSSPNNKLHFTIILQKVNFKCRFPVMLLWCMYKP